MILDTAVNVTSHLPALKAQGVTAIIRYLTRSGGPKRITPTEAAAIGSAGMQIGLVFEEWGGSSNFAHGDINSATGRAHAVFALGYMRDILHAPLGTACYFAVDNDATGSQLRSLIEPYFTAIRGVFSGLGYRVGVYASGNACADILDKQLADLAWLSNASGWGGFNAFNASGRWTIRQSLPRKIAGLDTDPDVINPALPDAGFWMPGAPAQPVPGPVLPPPPVYDAAWINRTLNGLGAKPAFDETRPVDARVIDAVLQLALNKMRTGDTPLLTVDGDIGPQTLAAVVAFLKLMAAK